MKMPWTWWQEQREEDFKALVEKITAKGACIKIRCPWSYRADIWPTGSMDLDSSEIWSTGATKLSALRNAYLVWRQHHRYGWQLNYHPSQSDEPVSPVTGKPFPKSND